MSTNRTILLVVNPNSGSMNKSELVPMVCKEIQLRQWQCEVYETTGENDAAKIEARIIDLKPYRIVIAGGDGTINFVAHILKDFDISIGIIPAGSANGLASNFNLPPDLESQIKVALGEKTCAIDHLKVNDHTCLHIADLGLNAELIANFDDATIRGKFGYFLQTIPTLINTDAPFDFTIEINGELLERRGILVAIANAKQYGTGATINPNGRLDDGKFEVLIFKTFDTLEIIRTIYDKVDLDSEFAECHSDNKVVITTRVPVPFQIDGEPMEKTQRVEASFFSKQLIIAIS